MAAMDRKEALMEVFNLIDVSADGLIDLVELKALASGSSNLAKLYEARETMSWLDLDGDQKVTPDEFLQVFTFLSANQDDHEFESFLRDIKTQTGGKPSRDVLLKRVFSSLDKDRSGFIELHELKLLVGCVAPAESMERAQGTLRMFDTNSDERVSVDEFLAVFGFLSQDMNDTEFGNFISKITEKGFEMLYESDYRHPHGCREWLQAEVVPVLRRGFLALLQEVEKDAIDVAMGQPWEEGAHMPRGWRPLSPMRWLADWLVAAATGSRPGTLDGGLEGDGGERLGAAPQKSLETLTRAEKIAYLFKQMDTNGTGCIPAPHLVSAAMLMLNEGAAAVKDPRTVIDNVLASLGIHPFDSSVDLEEFAEALSQMTAMLSDFEFEEAARVVAAQRDWRYCRTRSDKFRYLFHSLDLDHSGSLNFKELKVLAQRMDPDTSEETVAATFEYLDRDNSDSVSMEEFVEAMSAMLHHVEGDGALDDMVQRMLNTRSEVDAANEVEPKALADFVRNLRTHLVAAQMPTSTVMDKLTGRQPLVLLDVRSEEERTVSVMPGAIPIALQPAPSANWGYLLAGGAASMAASVRAALGAAAAAAMPISQPPVVAVYCSTGELGGVAALLLSDALRLTVYNVCGGIINYYNQGGSVIRGSDGKQVQALHPGSGAQRAFITRPNIYK